MVSFGIHLYGKENPIMELKLYRIHFEPVNPVGEGFALVLATNPEIAKESWFTTLSQEYVKRYGRTVTKEALAKMHAGWERRWHHTELIPGPFSNGFVICSVTGDY